MKTETIEGNTAIAIFMGMKYYPANANPSGWVSHFRDSEGKMLFHQDLQYHSSWDWLMPSWRKVCDVIGVWAATHPDVNIRIGWGLRLQAITNSLATVSIDTAFQQITEAIKWHNQQK